VNLYIRHNRHTGIALHSSPDSFDVEWIKRALMGSTTDLWVMSEDRCLYLVECGAWAMPYRS
jgi:hypothetical protein